MLTICNEYPSTMWAAYMFHAPDACGGEGGDWQVLGWWPLQWRQCAVVYANDLDDVGNRYWYYYAHSQDGREWAGDVPVYVPNQAFNRCFGLGSSDSRIVNFRQFDVGDNDNFTLTLTG